VGQTVTQWCLGLAMWRCRGMQRRKETNQVSPSRSHLTEDEITIGSTAIPRQTVTSSQQRRRGSSSRFTRSFIQVERTTALNILLLPLSDLNSPKSAEHGFFRIAGALKVLGVDKQTDLTCRFNTNPQMPVSHSSNAAFLSHHG
jgi:hypothetical protein